MVRSARAAQYRAARALARFGSSHPRARWLLAQAAAAAARAWDAGHRVHDIHDINVRCARTREREPHMSTNEPDTPSPAPDAELDQRLMAAHQAVGAAVERRAEAGPDRSNG